VDEVEVKIVEPITNAFTVDVEDYFQVEAFQGIIRPEQWDNGDYPTRVVTNTRNILRLLERHNVHGTFFVLGWVAQRYPTLIADIAALGHEVGCHGFAHQRATTQTFEVFLNDVLSAKHCLEDIVGVSVDGYRAPSFSINENNQWAFDALAKAGFLYSSSTYPVKHDLYGVPNWPRFPHLRPEGILEIPVPTLRIAERNIPIGGGGYFRLAPYALSHKLIERYLVDEQKPYSFYFHPWEIDPDQPRIANATLKSKVRHYVNLGRMENKVSRLLSDFQWSTMKDVYSIQGKESAASIRA
jgi:polysaccharide deacetylase family protein (PEP-CTERM system associated)